MKRKYGLKWLEADIEHFQREHDKETDEYKKSILMEIVVAHRSLYLEEAMEEEDYVEEV